MKRLGIFTDVNTEIGDIIVATVDGARLAELVKPDGGELDKLIAKS